MRAASIPAAAIGSLLTLGEPVLAALPPRSPAAERPQQAPEQGDAAGRGATPGPRTKAIPVVAHGCALDVEGGPRAGLTVNDDQWIVGGHLRLGFLCLGGLAVEGAGAIGFGGNYLTLRPSVRAIYRLYIDARGRFEIHPIAGMSVMQWLPVAHFARWCNRFEVDACWARDSGAELGAGMAYRFLGLEAVAGFGSLPVVTLALTATWPLAQGEP